MTVEVDEVEILAEEGERMDGVEAAEDVALVESAVGRVERFDNVLVVDAEVFVCRGVGAVIPDVAVALRVDNKLLVVGALVTVLAFFVVLSVVVGLALFEFERETLPSDLRLAATAVDVSIEVVVEAAVGVLGVCSLALLIDESNSFVFTLTSSVEEVVESLCPTLTLMSVVCSEDVVEVSELLSVWVWTSAPSTSSPDDLGLVVAVLEEGAVDAMAPPDLRLRLLEVFTVVVVEEEEVVVDAVAGLTLLAAVVLVAVAVVVVLLVGNFEVGRVVVGMLEFNTDAVEGVVEAVGFFKTDVEVAVTFLVAVELVAVEVTLVAVVALVALVGLLMVGPNVGVGGHEGVALVLLSTDDGVDGESETTVSNREYEANKKEKEKKKKSNGISRVSNYIVKHCHVR